MRIGFICLVYLCNSFSGFSQDSKMSLKQCIETAFKNNIQVKQAGLQAEVAAVNTEQAKMNLLPDLNGSYSYGFNKGRSVDPQTNGYINQQLSSSNVGLSSSVLVYNGMRLLNLVKQSSLSQQAAKLDWQQSKDNLALNVILTYLQVLSNEDVLAISKGQVGVTKKQLERMEILVKEGVSANYLLADLKGQLANEEISVINSQSLVQQSKLSLCQLMNIDYNSALQLERIDVDVPLEKFTAAPGEVYEASLKGFAAIKANDFKIKSAGRAVKVAQSGFYPTVSLNGNLSSNYSSLGLTNTKTTITEQPIGGYVIVNGVQTPVLEKVQNFSSAKTSYTRQLNNNLGSFIGINMQIPLFNSFQTRNRVKLAKIALQNIQLDAGNTKTQLKQNIEQAYINMTASFERSKLLTEQVTSYEESFRAADVRFNNGVINSAEYLISKNNLNQSRISLAQAKYEYQFRIKLLDYYQGKNLF